MIWLGRRDFIVQKENNPLQSPMWELEKIIKIPERPILLINAHVDMKHPRIPAITLGANP